jgi:hypothetical protein
MSAPALAVGATQSPAASGPAQLDYVVFRDGEPVGRHVIEFNRLGDSTNVKITTHVAVKLAFITVYRFDHSGFESWRGNHLVVLKSETYDDGTSHRLSVTAEGDHLNVAADGTQSDAPAAILPASLWQAGTVHQSSLLNTLDGSVMRVSVRDEGEDLLNAGGKNFQAHHYKMSGGLERELWFDKSNTLVRLQFAAKDGSNIVYQLR